ncbi:LexA/Signal peptidase [Durotheca rogersii]|uniref:LexA/Signal peptidase n=1 Tax=Durotheca rogersii TaxID=419775 RepID=UPI00221FBA32|nr:LexA/Signal peptidase [Durotheca rogersii]KAI5865584.1 LexA/Signal peptidase [Durotheca rogersii]
MPSTGTVLGHPFRALLYAAKGLALGHLVAAYGWSPGYGWGPSMLPTFRTGEWFVTSRAHRRGRGVRVGDCVVYAIPSPPASAPPGSPGEDGVKRVLGLPGDYVLLNEPGLRAGAAAAAEVDDPMMIQVPHGHCYVVGDNLPWSKDSRDFGPLPMALIKGKVVARISVNGWWPPAWFSRFETGLEPLPAASLPT